MGSTSKRRSSRSVSRPRTEKRAWPRSVKNASRTSKASNQNGSDLARPLLNRTRQTMNDNIFSGLKVVDFASFIAGPSAAVILSDFGADVIKVEPPKGEMWRIGQKIPPQPDSDVPYPFQLANRNKRSLALDLKSPEAGKILERLVKWADVFVVNTPHPARKKLKLTYEDVVQWNPRLVYADITGYGEKGPDAALP